MLTLEKLRTKFEKWISEDVYLSPNILERTSGAPGMLRDYKNQETELQWRSFIAGYKLKF